MWRAVPRRRGNLSTPRARFLSPISPRQSMFQIHSRSMPRFRSRHGPRDSWNDGFQKSDKLILYASAGLKNFFCSKGGTRDAGGHVGDAGDAKNAQTGMPCSQHLRHGGHPDKVRAESTEGMNLRRCFVVRACKSEINAFVKVERELFSFFPDEAAEFRVIRARHIREARAEAIFIRSDKGVRALQVDVVANGDQGPFGITEIDPSSGVGENERLGAHPREHTNRKRNLLRRVAFVQMNTALHSRDRNAIHGSKDELSRMSDCRRSREVRNL